MIYLFTNKKNITKIDRNICSKECCNFTQWESLHMQKNIPDGYYGSNLMCNKWWLYILKKITKHLIKILIFQIKGKKKFNYIFKTFSSNI